MTDAERLTVADWWDLITAEPQLLGPIVALVALFWIGGPLVAALMTYRKRRSVLLSLALSLFFSPLAALIVAAVLPPASAAAAAKSQPKTTPEPAIDFYPTLRAAIYEARRAGYNEQASALEQRAFGIATTSSERAGEAGEAIREFLKTTPKSLPQPLKQKLDFCLSQIARIWPKYARARA